MVNVHARYLDLLEAEGWLDRSLEFLPTDKQIAERQAAGQGLQTPEFAVLLAYTKNADVTEVDSDLPDDPYARRPSCSRTSRRRCASASPTQIRRHRLRREIVATNW
jgi:glutamate dehydrogenase